MVPAKVTLAALLVSIYWGQSVQLVRAQVQPSSAQAYSIHDSLLKCYLGLGKGPETEAEYKWLLAATPSNAAYHFNYAIFLQHAGKKKRLSSSIKKRLCTMAAM